MVSNIETGFGHRDPNLRPTVGLTFEAEKKNLGWAPYSMTKCRKPFGHLLTSFDIFEKDVGGGNEREIFV